MTSSVWRRFVPCLPCWTAPMPNRAWAMYYQRYGIGCIFGRPPHSPNWVRMATPKGVVFYPQCLFPDACGQAVGCSGTNPCDWVTRYNVLHASTKCNTKPDAVVNCCSCKFNTATVGRKDCVWKKHMTSCTSPWLWAMNQWAQASHHLSQPNGNVSWCPMMCCCFAIRP